MFYLKDRAYTDNDILEIAAKLLPAHPTGRYKSFPALWKKTRKAGGYVPRPQHCNQHCNTENDLFPCCLSCVVAVSPEKLKETLARRSANVGWLMAEWWWDFGWILPEEFVFGCGIGITVPDPPVERDRVFVLDGDLKRKYLEVDLKEHAAAGANQHEARMKIVVSFPMVSYPGEIVGTRSGTIYIAKPRTILFGRGIEILERYIFELIEMPYSLPVLLDGSDIVREGDKILLNGIALN